MGSSVGTGVGFGAGLGVVVGVGLEVGLGTTELGATAFGKLTLAGGVGLGVTDCNRFKSSSADSCGLVGGATVGCGFGTTTGLGVVTGLGVTTDLGVGIGL